MPIPPPLPSKLPSTVSSAPAPVSSEGIAARPIWIIRWWRKFWDVVDWLMGVVALICGLAILAVIPILNFLSLGYLLEVSGRIARTGRFKAGFIGIRKASAVGSLVVGTWLVLLPVRFVSDLWKDAELISPGSGSAQGLRIGLIVMTVLAALHISWAAVRGGRLRHFFWPAPIAFFKWLGQNAKFTQVRNGVLGYIKALRFPYYFWLGFRGFVGALIWLGIPVLVLFGAAHIGNDGLAFLCNLVGGGLLLFAAMYLPFIQANFAKTGKVESFIKLREVRNYFSRAPFAFWISLFATVLFAFPLYILKVELPPQDLAWIPSILFVVFIFPARMLVGWALARAERQESPRHPFAKWLSRLGGIPVVGAYVFIVWLTQYLSFNGSWSLLEQHAFLVPAPILGL
ncbi:MAG: hypothetical protein ACKVJU_23870 [Verrucomicrobiales bacterium]